MLASLLDLLLWVLAIAVWVPCAIFFAECLIAALLGTRERPAPPPTRPLRKAVLMPAHNEERVLAATLDNVLPQLGPNDLCLVVADNCDDRTADIARAHGARVVERHHATDRGKGFALAFGLEQLAQDPPDVVVIVDADCTLSPGALDHLAALTVATDRPVQADYLLTAPERPSPKAIVSALAFLVRNRVRPLGLWHLGLPCHLTGTGMAFTWPVIRKAPPTGAYLVEDLLMGLDLALLGHPPLYTGLARVESRLPERDEVAAKQRSRWEHGQLTTVMIRGPRMIAEGLKRRKLDLLALGLDLIVPPLALLVLLASAVTLVCAIAALLFASPGPFWLAASGLLGVALGVLLAWGRFGRETLKARYLLAIPLYVLWKIPLYLRYAVGAGEKKWQRTERE
jgi:cellulose synthase/poly-beta-1,6-N-acetylglucosamine synthase-like glycosyltransferase